MSDIPGNLRYAKTHEWIRLEGDGTATVGINLRCIEGIDVDKLRPRPWDGRSM